MLAVSSHAAITRIGKLFTADRELSSSMVTHLMQDQEGKIWISTENGLNCYDGAKFRVYTQTDGDDHSLPSSHVNRTFLLPATGEMFVATIRGLCLYDPLDDSFLRIPLTGDNGKTIPSISVTSLVQIPSGQILVGTAGHGLYTLEKQGKDYRAVPAFHRQVDLKYIYGLYVDHLGLVWISGENARCVTIKTGIDGRCKKVCDLQTPDIASCFCEDHDGALTVGTLGSGLLRFDAASRQFQPLTNELSHAIIRSLLLDTNNNLLVGTDGMGQWVIDHQTGRLFAPSLYASQLPLQQAKVFSILRDAEGNVWEGISGRGVALFPNRVQPFTYMGYRSPNHNIIGQNSVTCVLKDHSGLIWVGTENDALYQVREDGTVASRLTEKDGLPLSTVMALLEDSHHTLWIGTVNHGLMRLSQGRLTRVTGLTDEKGRTANIVSCLAEGPDGQIYAGTSGNGLFRINPATGKVTCLNRPVNNGLALTNYWVNCLLPISAPLSPKGRLPEQERLYVGTYYGLNLLNLETGRYDERLAADTIMNKEIVLSLTADSKGTVFAGTTRGLVKLTADNRVDRRFTTRDGLPSDIIRSMELDGHGHLWLGTGYGLSRMTTKGQFSNYYAGDGLQGNEFSPNASFATSDGQMFFGGLNGLSVFSPDDVSASQQKPQLRVADFYVDGKPLSPQQAFRYDLDHDDNTFTIEFATQELFSPERIRYSYALNDGDYTLLPPGINSVTLSHLPPTTYLLRVIAHDLDQQSEPMEIVVVVHPAWYASWWAKLLYFLLLLTVIAMGLRYLRQRFRQKEVERERQRKEQENEAKLKFLMNISHELRTPMSMIISPATKLLETDEEPHRRQQYDVILRNAQRIMRLITQMLDVRKIEKGQMSLQLQPALLTPIAEELCLSMDYAAGQKNIGLTFHSLCPDVWAKIDPSYFDKILLNLLSNAIKFTPEGGHIGVLLQQAPDGQTALSVTDNGIGISEENKLHIFDRFYQIRNNINSAQPGTGIGLNLAYSLAQMHGGTLRVADNPEGQGTSFILSLPPCEAEGSEKSEVKSEKSAAIPKTSSLNRSLSARNRLLLVDDDPEIRQYVSRELADTYHVQTASNGREAWNLLINQKASFPSKARLPVAFDLVLTDVMMPEMDGIELCRKIKQNIQVNSIPVVMLTAMTDEDSHLRSLNIGADGYVTKPFSLPLLRQTLTNVLRNRSLLQNYFEGNQQKADAIDITAIKEEASPDEKLMARILRVVEQHISDPKLNVEFIAQEAGLSRVHLYRKLKELTNQSPSDFVRNIRLQKAAELLKEDRFNVAEISTRMGFSSHSAFSRAFKDFFGVSPKEYGASQ